MGFGTESSTNGGHELSLRRRRPLCDAIAAGFESMRCSQIDSDLSAANSNSTGTHGERSSIDGEGSYASGYVVWVPRPSADRANSRLAVLYGGGYADLYSGGLADAANGASCFFPSSMRWVRLVLEFLPAPTPPQRESVPSMEKTATHGAFTTGQCDAQNRPNAEQQPLQKDRCGSGSCVRDTDAGRAVADVWWLTDPSPPRVYAEAFRLRVGMEAVDALVEDTADAPTLVCHLEVCEGRPYAPGRLYRYPNVATSSGQFRSVYSYRVPTRKLRDGRRQKSRDGGSSVGEEQFVTLAGSIAARQEPSREEHGEISITDVKPSQWYNVRHRFSWQGVAGADYLDEEYILQQRFLRLDSHDLKGGASPIPSQASHEGIKQSETREKSDSRLRTTKKPSSRGNAMIDRCIYDGSMSSAGSWGEDGITGVSDVDNRRDSDSIGRWSRWKTVCKTRRTSENVELPRDDSSPQASLLLVVGLQFRVAARRRVDGGRRTMFSEVQDLPRDLLQNLCSIENIRVESDRLVKPSPTGAAMTRKAEGRRRMETGEEGSDARNNGWVLTLAERYSFANDEERGHFASRVAWELQCTFWRQESKKDVPRNVVEDPRVIAEAESIQRIVDFPVNLRVLAGVICEMDAAAGGA